VCPPLYRAHALDAVFELVGELDQNLDEVGHRAAGRADVGHEQDGVPGGLVDLDAVPVHQVLLFEHVPVDAGRSDVQGQPTRVEDELVLFPRLVHLAERNTLDLSMAMRELPPE
jgi:hypothetical protein